ncbi:MAG: enolase C-terminal domain-like protein [Bryobacterales bacterium]
MMGISALDNALWDLRGRHFEAPVYRCRRPDAREGDGLWLDAGLVGGARARRQTCDGAESAGLSPPKWFLAYGPGDGSVGLEKNIELVRVLREAVGPEVDLMFDAFMGWDLNYAMAWCAAVEQYRPRWLEEAFHVDKLDSFVQLARETTIPIATGEHFYGRWEVKDFLEAQAISVVQADPEWCGGVSELVKICALGSAFDAHVIPHGHNVHAAMHVVASQSPMTCPLVEFLILKMASYYFFDKHPPVPVGGKLELPDRPGFGMELDEAKIEKRTRLSWS